MSKQRRIALTDLERAELTRLIRLDATPGFTQRRARILLHADVANGRPYQTDVQIGAATAVDARSVARVRAQFAREGIAATLHRRPSARIPERRLDAAGEARLVYLACSQPPAERDHWSLRLLASRLVELEIVDHISPETVRVTLEKNELKPWKTERWCIPAEANAAFVAAMEDILDLYQRAPDPRWPLICLDEASKELQSDLVGPLPARPGRVARQDYEYARHGSTPFFLTVAPHLGWRRLTVTPRRTVTEFAHVIKQLVDEDFPDAERILLVMDNLNTHTAGALYATFDPATARRLWSKLEVHYTPKHGSWLNSAELELSVLARQCLNRRIPDRDTLQLVLDEWSASRNRAKTPITWRFTTTEARERLAYVYPVPATGQR